MNAAPRATVLVVDDLADNLALANGLLQAHYEVSLANNGAAALRLAAAAPPDLILLDVQMPAPDGYAVCARLRAEPATADIPVIFLTANDAPADEARGFAAGAVDYITKPISAPILLARVATHLALHRQKRELAQWNRELARRVDEAIAERERFASLRRFFSPAVAEKLVSDGAADFLKPRRREIVVVFVDLRGYTAFTDTHAADEVMRVLGEFHAAMGELVMAHGGTLERFAGDGMMIFFNDPVEISDPAGEALRMAQAMQRRFGELRTLWRQRGYELSLGIGIAQGTATLGAIGFEGRRDYGAIGGVTNLAARLCAEAAGGQILLCACAARHAGASVPLRELGAMALKGFAQPQTVWEAAR